MAVSNVRMPDEVYERLKAWAKEEKRSINDLTVEILERATRRRAALQALEAADRVREEIRAEYGESTDSTEMIRQMREERSNRG